jgi:choice-of-anchor B domain-containing protein
MGEGIVCTKGWVRRVAVVLTAGLLLAGLVGATGAAAHPGHSHGKGSGAAGGLGIEVIAPEALAAFHGGVQWGDTAEVDDQAGALVYAGTGCTPLSYLTVLGEIDGNIALIDGGANPDDPTDPCPVSTFAQKVNSAELAGAVGVVVIPAEGSEPNANATAVSAGIPALELHRTDEVLELREAVIGGETVEAALVDTYEPTELEALADVPCEDGTAGPFACDGIDLLSFVPQEDFDGEGISDLWGWTDPESGDEYVLIGKTNGVGIFRVSDPTAPVYLGELPNRAVLQEIWHDIKVYEDHAFIVSESAPHGMKVFDLTRLRDVEEPQEWDEDAFYPLTFSAHNIEVNTDTGYAYIVGGNAGIVVPDQCLSGLHMVDISTPTSPTFAGCYLEEGGPGTAARVAGEPVTDLSPAAYVHDAQCVTYDGPDERYTDREICFTSAENKIVVADVTDKSNPQTLGWTDYPDVAYAHQGWLTEDHAYLLVNDEMDELDQERIENSRTVVIDVTDLEDPQFHIEHFHDTRSITHNNYIVDGLVYQSNYTSGLRVLDTAAVGDTDDPRLEPLAFFDTFPTHGDPTFEGTWSNYPFFESGTLAVSGIDEGLFLLRLADDATDPGDGEGDGDGDEGDAPGDEAGVELACTDCPTGIRAGESGTADLEIANTGDGDDAFDLAVEEQPEGWSVTIDPDIVEVADGASGEATVTVEVPRRAQAGTYTVTVSATSASDPEVGDTTDIEVEVRKGPPSDGGNGDARPGDGRGQGNGNGVAATPAGSAGPAPTVPAAALLLALPLSLLGASALNRRLTSGRA